MPSTWIKMRTNLYDDPRVRQVAKEIKCHVVSVIGGLHTLWSLADGHSVDGFLSTYDPAELDRRVGRNGFAVALTHVVDERGEPSPWLVIEETGLRIPRFDEHNGESAKKRAQTSDRVKKHRERYTPVTQEALPEKIREEKNHKSAAHSRRSATGTRAGSDDAQAVDPTTQSTVDAIYRAYPRHEEPKAAKEAIRRALASLRKRPGMTAPDAWLLERTQAYAKARLETVNADPAEAKYTPYPQRWFNKARYDEPAESWTNAGRANGKGSHANGKHIRSAADRGEYASSLPSGSQRLDDDPADEEPT